MIEYRWELVVGEGVGGGRRGTAAAEDVHRVFGIHLIVAVCMRVCVLYVYVSVCMWSVRAGKHDPPGERASPGKLVVELDRDVNRWLAGLCTTLFASSHAAAAS